MDFYRLSSADDAAAALEHRMGAVLRLEAEPERKVRGRYFDSFDWRVYGSGRVLEEEGGGRHRRVILRPLGSSRPLRAVHRPALPRLLRDLAEGDPLRADLEPVLDIRALLPWIRYSAQRKAFRVLDDEGKTVLRVDIERLRIRSGDARGEADLGGWLRLVPVRGYEDWQERMEGLLVQALVAHPEPVDPMLAAARALGLTPGAYSSKLDFRLESDELAELAVKSICLGLLDTLEANVAGARAGLDTEFLHDLRVATRRTRSVLAQVKAVLDPATTERFKADFAWLQKISGPTRDMDVYLLAYPAYRASLPEPFRLDLEPFRVFLQDHQRREHARLARQLGSRRFRDLLAQWRAVLEGPAADPPLAANAARPIVEVAEGRIWKMYRRVRREGRAIGPDSPPPVLHELRKSCKKLRYLMEFFRSLYPSREIGELIGVLKGLLDNLGAFQDYQVQAGHLRGYAEQMGREGATPTATLLAMGMLVGALAQRQAEARQEFAQRFAVFDASESRARFEALFAPGARPGRAT